MKHLRVAITLRQIFAEFFEVSIDNGASGASAAVNSLHDRATADRERSDDEQQISLDLMDTRLGKRATPNSREPKQDA